MLAEQISVFVENKKGRLSEIADCLGKGGIDISALSLAESDEYGVLRMIVSEPHKAKELLRETGVIGKVTKVLAVAIDDRPGGFADSVRVLTENGIEIKYMYACVSHESGKALMILSVDETEKAQQLLGSTDAAKVDPKAIYRIK